jgi:hypothetical protein
MRGEKLMSEKMSKAVELSDEDLDSIAGGRALIVRQYGEVENIFICHHKKIGIGEFKDRLADSKNCDHFDGKSDNLCNSCVNCSHYEPHENVSLMKGLDIINPLLADGYGYKLY